MTPENSQVYNNLGHEYMTLGRYDEALECLNKAVELNGEYITAYLNKSTCLSTFSFSSRLSLT